MTEKGIMAMSKICVNCGAEMLDEAKFCPACGTEVKPAEFAEQVSVNEEAQGATATADPSLTSTVSLKVPNVKAIAEKVGMEKIKKFGIIGGAAVAAIIVISILISVIFPSPKAVLKKGLDAIVDCDAKQFVSVLPSFYFEMDENMDKSDYIDMLEESMEDSYMEGAEYRIVKIEDATSSEKREIKKRFEYLEEIIDDFDVEDIKGVKIAKVKMDGQTQEMTLIKYKGKWCLLLI